MKKHFQYAKYIVRHKYYVFIAGLATKASLWRLLKHDWSKMLPSEWLPYAEYFYGAEPVQYPDSRPNHDLTVAQWKQDCEDAFNVAWLRHIHRNDHHWQHWVLRNDDGTTVCLSMPDHVIREMVADWLGAGRAITGRWEAAEWYAKNKDKMNLHPDTRAAVEAMLIDVTEDKEKA